MKTSPLVVVYGDPLTDALTRALAASGVSVLHPSAPAEVPRLGDIDALLVQVHPDALQGTVDPRACRRRVRSVLGDLAPLEEHDCRVVLLVQVPGAGSPALADGVQREIDRCGRRGAKGGLPESAVDAVVIPHSPDVADVAAKVIASLRGETAGRVEVAGSRR
ncbi:hypothetical protein [Herbiconiux sp. A18JL235]|uniref:Uncharacterized protein n=1 Tax=Herbiconiux sp. A18JL235 TaxID=3152363 RepID=A0AB39BFV3_9MICO